MITERSYTRLTLALDIIRKIPDGPHAGYHELGIIKHQISLYDTIAIERSSHMRIDCSDPLVPTDERNICWKMVDTIKRECGISENVHITIEKNIPVKGGLAGGSANAATVLRVCNDLWGLQLSPFRQMTIGRDVGMDVPFYTVGRTAFDTETTGVLTPVDTTLFFDFVLIVPEFGVATPEAYQAIAYNSVGRATAQTIQMRQALKNNDRDAVIALVHNDFENSVFIRFPRLAEIKAELLRAGCLQAVMSGSGSTVLGIARDREHAAWIAKTLPYRCIVTSTYMHPPAGK